MQQSKSQSPDHGSSTLSSRLQAIKIPQMRIVLSAIEDTLKDQKTEPTSTAYFAIILALLSQSISTSTGLINKELATSVVYLLDVVTPFTPQALLRSKFPQVVTRLAPVLTQADAEAPLLRPAIGCLESLLCAQNAAAWALPQSEIGPRRAVAGLLNLAVDHRPKVRKRALEALTKVLKNPPPTPSLDHPVADMCSEISLKLLKEIATASGKQRKHREEGQKPHEPALIHALQLVNTIAASSGGWPSKKIEPLCELLLDISRSRHEYLTVAAFDVFEAIFAGMFDEMSSAKLPRLMEVISELRPPPNDSHLLPPWIAVLSRGYDVSSQVDPQETFSKLPAVFQVVSGFLTSSSHNIRVSASEGLISFMVNCVPEHVLVNPSIYDEKVLDKLATAANELLSIKYQPGWMEVFKVLAAMFDAFRWRSYPLLSKVVTVVGELRGDESFAGKKEADELIGRAVSAMGPEAVLQILPLNLIHPKTGERGRAWMLPILRQNVSNARLAHFRSEFVPLSAAIFQKVIEYGPAPQTMEVKIFETIIQQIWALLPGYCNLPVDLTEAFDQSFAEQIANVLYKQVELRADVCKGLQMLIESNQAALVANVDERQRMFPGHVTQADARKNLDYLASYAGNMLAVLFNVYAETLPQNRGFILRCVNAHLSITPEQDLMESFTKIATLLEASINEAGPQTQAEKQKQKGTENQMPPMSHTFMDVLITMAIYLPRTSFATLFKIASLAIQKDDDPQLQKKAYKLIPRLAESEIGRTTLSERNPELQKLILQSADKATASARRDRLSAIAQVVDFLPSSDLHFIPCILSEVVISAKEVNEKARAAAFDLLVSMGEKMKTGGTVKNSRVPHMPPDTPDVLASLEEYFTMLSAGLAGSTPHMISASITALTRTLYQFRDYLPEALITNLVSTLDLFLTSKNREIVRSVLGFVKVCVISLPVSLMLPRLESLIPNLMAWSKEHKARFKEKVKHIVERMIRRFGIETVEKWCPEEDRKLIVNIRKTRDRRKRKKDAGGDGALMEDTDGKPARGRKGRFESEYDEAIYGSDSSEEDNSDDEVMGRRGRGKKKEEGQTFIIEDEEEPLDLLDPKALAHISSTRPHRQPNSGQKIKPKTNADGKLLLGGEYDENDDGNDAMVLDFDADGNSNNQTPANDAAAARGGVNAYVEAIKGKDAVQRGQRGKLKFSNKKSRNGGNGPDEIDMDKEEEIVRQDVVAAAKSKAFAAAATIGTAGRGRRRGGGGIKQAQNQRRGLGIGKTRGGRVGKKMAGTRGGRS